MKELFEVTAGDIKSGARKNFALCPVARTIARRYPGTEVGAQFAFYHENGITRIGELPEEIQEWIARYDQDLPVEPVQFYVEFT